MMLPRGDLQPKAITNYYPMPNEVFILGLSYGALAVLNYLMYLENRRTYSCYPSYETIGRAVKMSENTVRKYVRELEDKLLIETEPTTVTTYDGQKRNGNLKYTIKPIQDVLDLFYEQQMHKLDVQLGKQKAAEKASAPVEIASENVPTLSPAPITTPVSAPTNSVNKDASNDDEREWWEDDDDEDALPF